MDSDNEADILILTAVFGFASTLFMVLRLAIRKIKKRPLDISDYLTLIAIACVQARTALTTVVVLWGNNNDYLFDEHPDPTEIYHLKAVVLLFYRRIFSVLPAAARIIAIYWIVLCATYLAAQAACVLDCVPLRLYWQVVPNPAAETIKIHAEAEAIRLNNEERREALKEASKEAAKKTKEDGQKITRLEEEKKRLRDHMGDMEKIYEKKSSLIKQLLDDLEEANGRAIK
ncbi:uncharacterized protein G6M90_00g030190 [Metarhizium brunneum]|uniref:Uncharacterized protein n=1 Tax=Metarhizium brunneum TaxID=500148 RepID=A0A7D5UWF1_9HYPO|nr:hypothetical protein G6M90_00g030190 [Metarhizium brunneum]